jgi:hypothetical protein
MEGAYLNRYVTDEQRGGRPILLATKGMLFRRQETSCARSYRTLRDGSLEGRFPRHFMPGYDHAVPPGQNTLIH